MTLLEREHRVVVAVPVRWPWPTGASSTAMLMSGTAGALGRQKVFVPAERLVDEQHRAPRAELGRWASVPRRLAAKAAESLEAAERLSRFPAGGVGLG